jgi:hypothetical protein
LICILCIAVTLTFKLCLCKPFCYIQHTVLYIETFLRHRFLSKWSIMNPEKIFFHPILFTYFLSLLLRLVLTSLRDSREEERLSARGKFVKKFLLTHLQNFSAWGWYWDQWWASLCDVVIALQMIRQFMLLKTTTSS